ncbi:MAG: hypothetical protein OWQ59_03620 [Alicyclobacillaceae bacterium]|nr:hypothetical protein [Alicyclobacillaceae bacterium]
MTTRFSLAELATMLHCSVDDVRWAVDTLSDRGELTAESFSYGEGVRLWRISPSDVKRIQAMIEQRQSEDTCGARAVEPKRRVIKRIVLKNE